MEMEAPFDGLLIFCFIEKWRRKVRSYEYFNGEEKKNLIRIHYRLTNLVRVGGDVGEF